MTEVLTAPGVPEVAASSPLKETRTAFNPAAHLDYRAPARRYSMSDLGLDSSDAVNDFAVTEPFRLVTDTAVQQLTAELFSEAVQANCKFTSSRTPCCLRGVSDFSPLVREMWSSTEVTQIISEAAGIPLRPVMNYELGVANVQVPDARGDDALVDSWHFDSYPYVAIMLLSDPSQMTGGETVLARGDGTELAVNFPCAGSMIVLQGQHVRHCARRAVSLKPHPRITLVTSYVPADPMLLDQSVLRGPKLTSDLPKLFHEWAEYRLAAVAAKATRLAQDLDTRKRATGALADVAMTKQRIAEMIAYLHSTAEEMTPPPINPTEIVLGLTREF